MDKQIKEELQKNINLLELKISMGTNYLKELKEELNQWKKAQLKFNTTGILEL